MRCRKCCIKSTQIRKHINNISEDKWQFSISFLKQEISRCKQMGVKYIVVHPGAHMKQGSEIGLSLIAKSLQEVLDNTQFDDTCICLETMSGKGTECGITFEEVKTLISLLNNNSRVGVCLDTCHIHDGGYDIINSYEDVIKEFETIGVSGTHGKTSTSSMINLILEMIFSSV